MANEPTSGDWHLGAPLPDPDSDAEVTRQVDCSQFWPTEANTVRVRREELAAGQLDGVDDPSDGLGLDGFDRDTFVDLPAPVLLPEPAAQAAAAASPRILPGDFHSTRVAQPIALQPTLVEPDRSPLVEPAAYQPRAATLVGAAPLSASPEPALDPTSTALVARRRSVVRWVVIALAVGVAAGVTTGMLLRFVFLPPGG